MDYGSGRPRLVFYDENNNELEIINIEQEDRKSIGKILENHGFKKAYSGRIEEFEEVKTIPERFIQPKESKE